MSDLQRRISTAVIFSAVVLGSLFSTEWSFYGLFFLVSMACLWEYLNLVLDKNPYRKAFVLFLAVASWGAFWSIGSFYSGLGSWNLNRAIGWGLNAFWVYRFVIGFLSVSPFLLLIFELFNKNDKPFQNVGLSLLGIFYLVLPFIFAMPQLSSSRVYSFQGYGNYFTPNIVAGLLFLTWANDSFAYLIGSRIGKRKLFERISPKKTWEGTIGGGLACMLTSFGTHHYLGVLSQWDWLAIGLIVAVFGTIGDLVESMLKRSLGVKDSGHIMPGHGGFLDRFDAFIFAMPFVYLYLIFYHASV